MTNRETIDARSWDKINMWPLPSGELAVRPGLRNIFAPPAGRKFVGGFTVFNGFTNEVWHYLFDISTTTVSDLRMRIYDDDFVEWQQLALLVDVDPCVITQAVVQGEIIIASPDFATLWGLVGSGIKLATSVASTNTATTAISVPRGICTPWCNRVVIANGISVFVSDPIAATGGSPRTFVAENQNQRPAPVYGIFEGAGGMLVVVTARGTYGLDAGAAAVGIVGSNGADWRILNHHESTSFSSSCVVRGRVYGMTRNGYELIDVESDIEDLLAEQQIPRAMGDYRVAYPDFRLAKMFGGEDGPIIAIDDVTSMQSLSQKTRSWWRSAYAPTNFKLRGLLRHTDGEQMLLCENGVFRMHGNFDGDVALTSGVTTQPVGGFAGKIFSTPRDSRRVRQIQASAAVGGIGAITMNVRTALGSSTPAAYNSGAVVGTSVWGSGWVWESTPLQSKRLTEVVLSDDLSAEFGANRCGARVNPALDVDYSDSAPTRPSA